MRPPSMTPPADRPRRSSPLRRSLAALGVATAASLALASPAFATSTAERVPAPTSAAYPALTSASISGYRNNIVAMTNQHRANAGRAALRVSSQLTNACQAHSHDMVRMGRMTHTGSDGSNGGTRATRYGYRWSAWGENVAAGYTSSSSVVNAWMNSSGHRANMLSSNFTAIGIGVQRASNGTIYFCMLLAR